PRHIEFQFLADRHGGVRCIFERDCSTQRRHQKVLEEAPAPGLNRAEVDAMAARLEGILAALKYDVIGTVEMLYTPDAGFVFLEVNTRLQVEHAVTEAITGIDLVHSQIRLAWGISLDDVIVNEPTITGHAIEVRVYAEDPIRFYPSSGVLTALELPVGPGIRVEAAYAVGNRITPYYDPLIAKLIVHQPDRSSAIALMCEALNAAVVDGVKTNIPFLKQVLQDDAFLSG